MKPHGFTRYVPVFEGVVTYPGPGQDLLWVRPWQVRGKVGSHSLLDPHTL